MITDLNTILAYQNPALLDYFEHHHPEFTREEGQQLLHDLLAWMWLHALREKQGKKTYLFGPLLVLDKMWHVFILHTRDYMEFSNHYFGSYFHHDIEPIGLEHVMEEKELTDYLHDCFQHLGAEWVIRRFAKAIL